jgi:uncharacterized protein (DUF1778 family)
MSATELNMSATQAVDLPPRSAVQWPYTNERVDVATATGRTRSERLEVRTTAEDRALIDRAVAATDGDLTEFVVANLRVAALRVLADRSAFTLDPSAHQTWEAINRRPAKQLPGLRELMSRPSPFRE